jgi:hypothetical protein
MANGLLSNILGFNPATYQQEQLALLTNPIRQAKDPYERVGATLGSLIGGAFMAEDPQLKRAADIQSVLGGVQFDPANPAESYNSIARELANKGYAAEALTAAQEAAKFTKERKLTTVAPGASLVNERGEVVFTAPDRTEDPLKAASRDKFNEIYAKYPDTPEGRARAAVEFRNWDNTFKEKVAAATNLPGQLKPSDVASVRNIAEGI